MPPSPPLWLLLLWAAHVLQAWLSAGLVRRYLRLFRANRHRESTYTPRATVIVPFKGIDNDLASGVRGLCTQRYPDYSLLLVVESESDPACALLRTELARFPDARAQIIVAGPAGRHEGQKVHNQLAALARIYDTSGDKEIWVFADSDAIPDADWLARLVSPLYDRKTTGVATGYRWLMPEPPATFWSHLASVMNSSVACLMGKDRYNHAWGGSMALRAGTARRGDLRGRLEGALCDDYQFSRLSRDMELRIYFVPDCLVATPVRFTWASLWNFAHRQYLLTRIYAPKLFITALLITTLYVAGFASVWGAIIYAAATGFTVAWWPWALAAATLAFLGNQVRATLRQHIVRAAFGDESIARLGRTLLMDRWLTPVWMTLHWLIVVRSAFGRRMRWRGILYRLDGPQACERLDG